MTGVIFGVLVKEAKLTDSLFDKVTPELDKDGNFKPMATVEAFGRQFRVIVAEIE